MELLNQINDILWTYIIITMLVFCALYFTIGTRGVQFRLIGDMIKVMIGRNIIKEDKQGNHPLDKSGNHPSEKSGNRNIGTSKNIVSEESTNRVIEQSMNQDDEPSIGSFHAFAVSLSSRVGTGNLAGVASAIFIGGPGAVFWMWMMALLGSATAFVEATLAQLYKRRGADSYYGGPAYYMESGLRRRWMGILFAFMITITFGLVNQLVQSTTLCDAISDTFAWDKAVVGATVTIATLIVVFGGIQRIANFSSILVPFMAGGFIILSFVIMIMNITQMPHVIRLIIENAFGIHQMAGGAVGAAILQGVKRGLFSNEAGEGSAPNAAAIATTSHPVKQGLLQSLGVFTDTLIICSCTAFIVLLSGKYDCGKDGILLTAEALDSEIGSIGRYFITAAIFLFAYSTIIANYFYGETNIRFITQKGLPLQVFRVLTAAAIMLGALMDLQTAFSFIDIVMGLMTILNLIAIIQLFPEVRKLLAHYEAQKASGTEPTFTRADLPEAADKIDCWN